MNGPLPFSAPDAPERSTAGASDFEAAFVDAERQIGELAKHAAALSRAVKAAQKSAKVGDVRALSKAVSAMRVAAESVPGAIDGVSPVLTKDYATEIRAGSFLAELEALARKNGLRGVRVVHGDLLSFPVVVTPRADDLSVRFGRRAMPVLRPSVIIAELNKLRKRKAPSGSAKFVEAIEGVYLALTGGQYSRGVPIDEVYKKLTPLPAQKVDYTVLDFVSDLYLLEREGDIVTRADRRLTFPASTATVGGKAIRVATEDGEERLYSSIRFD